MKSFLQLRKDQQGAALIVAESALWSLFPIVTIIALNSLTPLYAVALSTLAAAVFFAFVLTVRGEWGQVRERQAWGSIAMLTLFLGIAFYVLYFWGLKYTTAGNAAVVTLLELFFSYIILRLLRHEFASRRLIVAGSLMVLGAFVVVFEGTFTPRLGDSIILLALFFPSLGNIYMQRARKLVSASFIMFWRSLFAGVILLVVAMLVGPQLTTEQLVASLPFVLINGVLLLGLSKVLWIEAIHRIPITRANTIAVGGVGLTLLFAYLILGEVPTVWQFAGLVLMLLGLRLLFAEQKDVARGQAS